MTCSRRLFMLSAALGPALAATGVRAAEAERRLIREQGLVGEFHLLASARKAPAVILLNGSDGGLPSARDARDLALAGFPTLALAYFKDWNGRPEGLPDGLREIPLEYFFRAISWLKAQPQVDPRRVVLAGLSRGAELALLLASMRPDIAGVAAFSPSSVVWQGAPPPGPPTPPKAAWTLDGKALPFQVDSPDRTLPVRRRFEIAPVNDAARIPVERIRGAVLLAASRADAVWPSDVYAEEIARRLAGRPNLETLLFDDASHLLMGTGPGITRFEIPAAGLTVEFGGTAAGTARARALAWQALKRLLAKL